MATRKMVTVTSPIPVPTLSPPALLAAGHLELIGPEEEPLAALDRLWSKHPVSGRDFCDFEAALVRLGKDYCRKEKHHLLYGMSAGRKMSGGNDPEGGIRGGDL